MRDIVIADALIEELRSRSEALDRGNNGPSVELALMRDSGLLTAPLPIADGGRGWGTSSAGAEAICALLMALGGASLPIARLYEGHVNAIALIVQHASDAQRARLIEAIHGGALLGVWGADSEQPVTLEEHPAGAVLAGVKAFASGLGDITIAVVTARYGSGLQMVIVSADDPLRADHGAWDVDAMVGSRSGRFDCTGLPANIDDRLAGLDALFSEPNFHGGVWRLVACYAGAMKRLAFLCADWLERRGSLELPLMKARLCESAIEAHTAMLWAKHASQVAETDDERLGDAICAALFAREAVEQAATRQLALVERLFGTAMHRRGSEAGRIARDLRFYLRQADLDGKLALAAARWLDGRS